MPRKKTPEELEEERRRKLEEERRRKAAEKGRPIGIYEKEGKQFVLPAREKEELRARGKLEPQQAIREAEQKTIEEERIRAGVRGEEAQERMTPELAQELGEAGVFREAPELVPIIPKEMENAGVLVDMATSLLPGFLKLKEGLAVVGIGVKGTEEMREAKERVTETELAVQNYAVDKALQTEIAKTYDDQIETELTQMGLGAGGVILISAATGSFVSSAVQLVGTDKKVKNLTTGIVKLETIATDIASTVVKGDMSFEEGIKRIEYIGDILNNMEAELQVASIESANVRISLKGRDVAIKILSGRSRIDTSIKEIGGFKVAGVIQDSPAHQKAAALSSLKEKYKAMQFEEAFGGLK